MKKGFFLGLLLTAASLHVNAQALMGTNFFDNWYVGLNGGGITPTTHAPFWKSMRGITGLEIGKQVSPVLGFSLQGLTGINTTKSKTAFDDLNISFNGKMNLNNLFGGYNGVPRLFEVEAVAGVGYGHNFQSQAVGDERNYITTRFGSSLNFNLGESKAVTLSLKPAIVYRLDGDRPQALNVNRSKIELLAGVTYHFGNSNGEHYMTLVEPMDPLAIEAVNDKVNQLRGEIQVRDQALAEDAAVIQQLQTQLQNCQNNQPEEVAMVVEQTQVRSLESMVTFNLGSSVIPNSQIPNVERIGIYMKNHPASTVVIKGYASPDGNLEFNQKLAQARAESVKAMLMKKYNISADRITAKGEGITDMFSEPAWNRVSIATLNENNN